MLPEKITFVDIETTGLRALYDRIIEIGILRVENGEITQTFQSLINPQTYIPSEITAITGITAGELENAPTFRQIKTDILELLVDTIFVAHNVRFDYGFLKSEFKRENISFSSRHFCTVKLSRFLYPTYRRHNLDAIIERFNLSCKTRHRAFDDAKVLYHFYTKLQQEIPLEKLEKAISHGLKQPSLPLNLTQDDLQQLPEQPGVYIFYADNDIPLYIGKSINIRERVLSHFASDIHAPFEMKISQQIKRIETIPTAGELGALLLESQLIKKLLPLYNKMSRIKHELISIRSKINADGYQECFIEPVTTITPDDLPNLLGVFKSKKQAKTFLAEIAKEHKLCERLLGLESASWRSKGECFAYRLNRCNGACSNKENPLVYNMRSLMAFSKSKIQAWPFKEQIVIEEQALNGTKDYFLINNWCYLGKITLDE